MSVCEMLIVNYFLDKYLRGRVTGSNGLNKVFDTFYQIAFSANVPIKKLAGRYILLLPNIG